MCMRIHYNKKKGFLPKLLIIVIALGFISNYFLFNKEKKTTRIRTNNNAICIVLTSEKTITTRGVAVWETWGKNCRKTVFTCSCKNIKKYNELIAESLEIPEDLKQFSKVANYPILYLNIDEDYNKMVNIKNFVSFQVYL